jgi:hypothetical protein
MSLLQRLIFTVLLGTLIAVILLGFLPSTNNFYVGAYRPVVEKSEKLHEAINRAKESDEPRKDSDQPRATGLREDEIKKERGYRYATF